MYLLKQKIYHFIFECLIITWIKIWSKYLYKWPSNILLNTSMWCIQMTIRVYDNHILIWIGIFALKIIYLFRFIIGFFCCSCFLYVNLLVKLNPFKFFGLVSINRQLYILWFDFNSYARNHVLFLFIFIYNILIEVQEIKNNFLLNLLIN